MGKKLKETIVFQINSKIPQLTKIRKAASVIKQGGVVAFPTETVYGLGADGLNAKACARIFLVKKRPANVPLILHVDGKEHLFDLTDKVPRETEELIDKFWPGPLTLVLHKSRIIPQIVTGGLNTVAVRMPDNLIALNLIKYAQTPIAAPSANLFGGHSPTCAQHVIDDLDGSVDIIIDGGKTNLGMESTVLDLTVKPFKILRPGGVLERDLKKILGKIKIADSTKKNKYRTNMSFSPSAKIIVVEKTKGQINKMQKLVLKLIKSEKKIGVIVTEENKNEFNNCLVKVMGPEKDLKTCALNLFSTLRSFDKEKIDIVIAQGIKRKDIGLVIMNRLQKVTNKNIK
ncbi:threonylcarbamoyl-AMP synthase [bacterium]|nr:threonylcarbamoyl-AMP synthase [bacterium]